MTCTYLLWGHYWFIDPWLVKFELIDWFTSKLEYLNFVVKIILFKLLKLVQLLYFSFDAHISFKTVFLSFWGQNEISHSPNFTFKKMKQKNAKTQKYCTTEDMQINRLTDIQNKAKIKDEWISRVTAKQTKSQN